MQSPASTFSLSRFIEDVHVLESIAGDPVEVDRLPDGRTRLVFRVLEEGRTGDLSASGPRTHAHSKRATGFTRVIVIQFKPGWTAPLLGVAANALTDRIVPLQDLWGRSGDDLCEALMAARSVPEVIDGMKGAIALRVQQTFEPASALLADQGEVPSAGSLASGTTVARSVTDGHGVTRSFTQTRAGTTEIDTAATTSHGVTTLHVFEHSPSANRSGTVTFRTTANGTQQRLGGPSDLPLVVGRSNTVGGVTHSFATIEQAGPNRATGTTTSGQ